MRNLAALAEWGEADVWYCGTDGDNVEGVEVFPFSDPGPDENQQIVLNYTRQYLSTRSMLQIKNFDNYDYVIKLRGDILISDIKLFKRFIENIDPVHFYVPEFNTLYIDNIFDYRWHLSDWVYVASPNNLRRILAKESQIEDVLREDENKKYIQHWVGGLTCEQAMLDQGWLINQDYNSLVRVFSFRRVGLFFGKYDFLYRPKHDNWKPYFFVRLTCYTTLMQLLNLKFHLLFLALNKMRNITATMLLLR